MARTHDLVRSAASVVSAVSPGLGARAALSAFFEARPRMRLRDQDTPTHDQAWRGTVAVRDEQVATYRWGAGAETVLLVHGWRGRASQFVPLVRELVHAGFQVVAFDAPGHGDSTGRRTDVRDWLTAIEQLHARHGPFRAIVGHSLGALATLTAVRQGVTARAVATIAGTGSTAAFLQQFSRMLGLDDETERRFRRAFFARLGEDEASAGVRYDALAHPLPADVPLLAVHDEDDRQLPAVWSERLVEAHPHRARLVRTTGFGHNRVLASDVVLDAVVALATGGLAAVRGVDRHEELATAAGGGPRRH